jgi:hypothetical protein
VGVVKEVSAWSISLKKTNKGFQARVFKGWFDPEKLERPTYYNKKNLPDLLKFLETEVVPKLEDNFIPVKRKENETCKKLLLKTARA